jgi:hypothetical protein
MAVTGANDTTRRRKHRQTSKMRGGGEGGRQDIVGMDRDALITEATWWAIVAECMSGHSSSFQKVKRVE